MPWTCSPGSSKTLAFRPGRTPSSRCSWPCFARLTYAAQYPRTVLRIGSHHLSSRRKFLQKTHMSNGTEVRFGMLWIRSRSQKNSSLYCSEWNTMSMQESSSRWRFPCGSGMTARCVRAGHTREWVRSTARVVAGSDLTVFSIPAQPRRHRVRRNKSKVLSLQSPKRFRPFVDPRHMAREIPVWNITDSNFGFVSDFVLRISDLPNLGNGRTLSLLTSRASGLAWIQVLSAVRKNTCSSSMPAITPTTNPFPSTGRQAAGNVSSTSEGRNAIIVPNSTGRPITRPSSN